MHNLRTLLITSALALSGAMATAAVPDEQQPEVFPLTFSDGSIGVNMSSNGKWVVTSVSSSVDAASATHTYLYNVDRNTYEEIPASGAVSDVTDDGNLIVGAYGTRPAYWTRNDHRWHTLSLPFGWHHGSLTSVTADGHYAVGLYCDDSEYYSRGLLWDIQNGREIVLTNLPQRNMQGENSGEMRFLDVSEDGRYVLIQMDYAYLAPPELCAFIYDVQEQSYTPVGYTIDEHGRWESVVPHLYFVDFPCMSPSGTWVAGTAYIVLDPDAEISDQYYAAFKMNVQTGEFFIYDADDGYVAYAVCDDGTLLGSTPATSPLRDWAVRVDNHWAPADLIFAQHATAGFCEMTGYDRTGTASVVSADGSRLLVIVDPTGESAVIDFHTHVKDLAADVNLLTNYSASPEAGSEFPKFGGATLTFAQKVRVIGSASSIQLLDATGTSKRAASGLAVGSNPMQVEITCRSTNLNAGEAYTLRIPAGTIALDSDPDIVNDEILIPYFGRANEPVAYTDVYPANDGRVTKIDNTESPIRISFNTRIAVAKGSQGRLTLVEDGVETSLCPLYFSADGNDLYVYPAATQLLFRDSEYRIDIPAGSVTDISGAGPNEAITIRYTGAFVRTISHDDENIFNIDFSNMSESLGTFMLYEGDHGAPTGEMSAIGFDADNTPWNFSLLESLESGDYFAGSHSLYSPKRQSDDWMMLPALYLPDEWCEIQFDAQRYRARANDRLKVVAWVCDDMVNVLTDAVMERVKAEGVTIFDEVIPNGGTDEGIAGEWQHYSVSLPEYAGKNVYFAFVNENEAQSAIFLDNLIVKRNLKFLLSIQAPDIVVARESQAISGVFIANSETEEITDVTLTLRDGEGNELESFAPSGLHLKKGDELSFAFANPVPLTVGHKVPYSVEVIVNGIYHEVIEATISNLAFSPTKRVVIEEMTGTTCGNCPLGIIAFDYLDQLYGEQVIPISIHTYSGDPYGSGLMGYTSYLGIIGAPTARVNRLGDSPISPIWQNPATGRLQFTSEENHDTWLDYVQAEFAEPAVADIAARVEIDEAAGTFSIPVEVTYALDASDVHLNLFAVVLEDMIPSYQDNYYVSASDPLLGEWANGGIYAQTTVRPYIFYDLARQTVGTTYAGTPGLLPENLRAGEAVSATLSAPLPVNLLTRKGSYGPLDYCRVVVMLINADNGRVINSIRVPMTDNYYITGIDTPEVDIPLAPAATYDLSGRRVNGASMHGIRIEDGRLIYRK